MALLVATCPASSHSMGTMVSKLNRHPVSIVDADIYVNRKKITMRLTCFAEDLELLQGVSALEDGLYDDIELMDATVDHGKYLGERIILRDANGEKMKPKLVETVEIEFPDEGIKAGTLMNYKLSFVFEFVYKTPPEFITIQQEMVAEGALLPSELKILMKQAGSDTPFMHMMKPSQPETFQFDWEKPVLSAEASEQEWEVWFEEQREKNLGITSYSSVYSFIYITAHEVRHEVLIPLATLATFIDIERKETSFLDIEEQEAAAEKIKAFFSIGNPVRIDSVQVQPVFDRVDFYGLDLRDFAVQAEKRRVSMASGRVGVIMSYSTKGAPTNVEVEWDKFNEVMKSVSSVVFAYENIEKTEFSKFLSSNVYQWEEPDRKPLPRITNVSTTIDLEEYGPPHFKISMVSAALFGGGLLVALLGLITSLSFTKALIVGGLLALLGLGTMGVSETKVPNPYAEQKQLEIPEEDARQVFAQLHKNMFRAFDYRKESDVYDALARSVDGDLLRKLYRDVNQTLRVKEQGGAVSNVNEVNLLDGSKTDMTIVDENDVPGFKYRCKWNLIGTIEHWGHIHERKNEYDADFTIQVKDDSWKITGMEVLDEEQGVVKTSLRKF